MELFNENGCLTEEAITKIIDQQLGELHRLEISEHLSFCDSCLLRYSNAVCEIAEDKLLEPTTDIRKHIIYKIKQQTVAIFYNRYVAITIAASFAILMTFTGIFDDFANIEFPIAIKFEQKKEQHYEQNMEEIKQQQYSKTNKAIQDFISLSFLKGE